VGDEVVDTNLNLDATGRAQKDLVVFGRRMLAEGLAIGTAGNLSIRVGDLIAITPSSIPYADVETEDICVLTLDGEQVSGRAKVSSEWPMHSGIYRTTGARAVVHTHSTEVVALSVSREELPAIHYAIHALGGPVPVVGYTRFGTDGLARGVADVLATRTAAILQNHGAVTFGDTIAQAYERAHLLEWLAGVYRRSLTYGSPRILSTEEMAEVAAEVSRRRYGGPAANGGATQ
jgi:L-fuculose-phosphate aldolase